MTIMLLAPTWKTWMISPQAGAMDDDKVYAAFNNAFSSHSDLTLWVQHVNTCPPSHNDLSQLDVVEHFLVQLRNHCSMLDVIDHVSFLAWEVKPHARVTSMVIELCA